MSVVFKEEIMTKTTPSVTSATVSSSRTHNTWWSAKHWALLLVLGILLAACGGSPALTSIGLHYVPKLYTHILVSNTDMTLYTYGGANYTPNECTASSGCAQVFQPVLLAHSGNYPLAGKGVNEALFGATQGPGGELILTYDGYPLFTYSADKPGSSRAAGLSRFGLHWGIMTSTTPEFVFFSGIING